jgi:hypothetical protein
VKNNKNGEIVFNDIGCQVKLPELLLLTNFSVFKPPRHPRLSNPQSGTDKVS